MHTWIYICTINFFLAFLFLLVSQMNSIYFILFGQGIIFLCNCDILKLLNKPIKIWVITVVTDTKWLKVCTPSHPYFLNHYHSVGSTQWYRMSFYAIWKWPSVQSKVREDFSLSWLKWKNLSVLHRAMNSTLLNTIGINWMMTTS